MIIPNETNTAIKEIEEKAKKSKLYTHNKKIVIIRATEYERPKYLIIGEAPGQEENITGIPFVGKSGKLLNSWLEQANITSYAIINTVPLMPLTENGKIRAPTPEEIKEFKQETTKLINALMPRKVILLGRKAEQFWIGKKEFETPKTIGNLTFFYHPSYFLRRGEQEKSKKEFEKTIKKEKQE